MVFILVFSLLAISIFMITILFSYRKINLNMALTFFASVVFFAFVGFYTVQILKPMYSYSVAIELTGKQNLRSKGYDIGINAIQCNGRSLDLKSQKEIKGRWIYNGETLSWNNAKDRNIEILVPCFANTQITFQKNIWAGIVCVKTYNKQENLDLFSVTNTTYEYTIHPMPTAVVLKRLFQIGSILFIELVFSSCIFVFFFIIIPKKLFYKDESKQQVFVSMLYFLKKKPIFFIRILITSFTFLIMLSFADDLSLWADDLATISFVAENVDFSILMERIMYECGANPPLFYIFAYFWIRVAPYGTIFLKLPSIIFSCLGIWFCGVAAKRIQGERAAVIAVGFSAFSYFLVSYAALTFRCYGLLFMLCPLMIMAYHKRLEQPECLYIHMVYGMINALLLYTNYICMLIVGIMGLFDFWLIIRKRMKLKCLLSYLFTGILFLPLLLYAISGMVGLHKVISWMQIPDFHSIEEALNLIFNNQWFLVLLFFVGMVTIVLITFSRNYANLLQRRIEDRTVTVIMVIWPVFVFSFMYIYSRYLNPDGSLFIYRYFISILAPAMIVAAIGLDWILVMLSEGYSKRIANLLSIVSIFGCLFSASFQQLRGLNIMPGTVSQPYEQCIDWIYAHEVAHMDDTLVIITGYQGGLYYYGTHGGQRPDLNYGELNDTNWKKYKTVFAVPMHGELANENIDILNTHFIEQERNDEFKVVVYEQKQT